MHIGVLCHPTHGGSGVVATELGLAMAQRGHIVHFVNYSSPFRLSRFHPNVRYHEVEVTTYPLYRYPPYDLALAAQLAEVAHAEGLDLVHAHYAIPHAIAADLGRAICGTCPFRILTTLHGTDITLVGRDRSFHRLTRHALDVSDALTAVSRFLADATVQEFAPKRPVRVIPNFVDTQRFRPGLGEELRKALAPGGEAVIAHVSNFRPVKRALDVVEVFARVAAQRPARLVLVGTGPDLARVQERVRAGGLSDRVVYLGLQEAVAEVLSAADLFLLTSESEGFGLAALEAMACGTPVVSSNAGGLPEVVEDGVSGRLLAVGDVDGMAGACLELLADREALRRCSEGARADALERFGQDKVVDQYEAVYRELVG